MYSDESNIICFITISQEPVICNFYSIQKVQDLKHLVELKYSPYKTDRLSADEFESKVLTAIWKIFNWHSI